MSHVFNGFRLKMFMIHNCNNLYVSYKVGFAPLEDRNVIVRWTAPGSEAQLLEELIVCALETRSMTYKKFATEFGYLFDLERFLLCKILRSLLFPKYLPRSILQVISFQKIYNLKLQT